MEENQARQRAAQDRLGLLLRNKKGSSMVEATIVFPLVILVVMAVILILAFLYNEVATSTKSHLALTEAMGRETETVWVYKNVPENIAVTQGRHLLKPCFFSKE
ncbi:MAG: pilus assembly protein, partial [Anaerovoracaceae bacterium]